MSLEISGPLEWGCPAPEWMFGMSLHQSFLVLLQGRAEVGVWVEGEGPLGDQLVCVSVLVLC